MSNTPTLLPFRFFNFNKKNKFLKIVQQKGFEVMSENQTVLSATTRGGMSQGILDNNSYSTSSYTENVVAYDIGIKKILDDEDKKYIDLLAEYFNFNGIKRPGFFVTIILGYIMGLIYTFLAMFLAMIPGEYIFGIDISKNEIIMIPFILYLILSGPVYYYRLRKKSIENELVKYKNYQDKLKPYLQGINF